MKNITTLDKSKQIDIIEVEQEYGIIEILNIADEREDKTIFYKIKKIIHYNLLYIILVIVFAISVTILARDIITKQKPDITILVLSSKNQIYDYTDKLQKVFEKSIDDVNGDGEKDVCIAVIPVNDETKEIAISAQTKLFTKISGGSNMIFISDGDCDKVINSAALFKNFESYYPKNLNIKSYKYNLKSTNLSQMLGWDNMPDDLYIAITPYDEGMAVTKEKAKKQYEIAKSEFNNFVVYIT